MKNIFKNIKEEIIHGGHILSLGGGASAATVAIILGEKISLSLFIIGYLILQIIYTYNHLRELKKDKSGNPERFNYVQKRKNILPFFIFIYFITLCTFSYLINIQTFVFVFVLLMGGILFSLRFKKITKRIPLFKNIYTAAFWATGTVFLPLFYYSKTISNIFLVFFIFVFIRAIINTIYFDIKDINSDKKEGLKTVPVLIGKHKTLNLLQILNMISFLPIIFGVYFKVLPCFVIILLIFYFYSYYYIKKSKKIDQKNIRTLSYIMVDAEYLFWPLFLFLSNNLF